MTMELPITAIIKALWALFALYWIWGWRKVKRANRSEPWLPRLFKYWLPLALAIWLLFPGHATEGGLMTARMYPRSEVIAVLGMLLVAVGISFACWARHVIGSNWSSEVQVKQGHELIERGPYGLVRHPIYTGLLLAFLGTAAAVGEWHGLVAVVIIAASFWFKLRLEERWMRESFGQAYVDYTRRVKALIPGVL
jgi:protein-S-isoprenylcysteine O-methyltransferase Ste14